MQPTEKQFEEPKGKALNTLADKYLFHGIKDCDYETQKKELSYLVAMAYEGELRLAYDEWGPLNKMIRECDAMLRGTEGVTRKTHVKVVEIIRS